jgi:two-component system response regulator HydG
VEHKPVRSPRLACVQPFDGTRLCKVCVRSPVIEGLRRCSRVVAESEAMRGVLRRVSAIAGTSSSVVIHGETGTGKEVIARLLHANSGRAAARFVALNVAALPGELLESELFGHVQGAFTGAVASTSGVFAAAHGGTLFLDEIGEMPLALQAKLLRALQDGEIRRVGDTRTTAVDVRVVCATHRDLRAAVVGGQFREDLYYRLKVFAVSVPPLRERTDDILPLARMFAEQLGAPDCRFGGPARAALVRHAWPGNVRELGNAVEHAVALARGEEIEPEHLPEDVIAPAPAMLHRGVAGATGAASALATHATLAEVEREHILRVLDACGGNQLEAARQLGIGRNTLWRKLRVYAAPAARAAR